MDYLARLKAKLADTAKSRDEKTQKPHSHLPSKPSKAAFECFDSRSRGHISSNEPAPHAAPRIVREPPFGSDDVPKPYEAAWQAMLARHPPGVRPIVWEAAIYDAALLFGDWGSELARLGWQANDLFAVPRNGTRGGLLWFIKGSPVVAIGQTAAFVQDGRLYRRPGL